MSSIFLNPGRCILTKSASVLALAIAGDKPRLAQALLATRSANMGATLLVPCA